MAAPLIPDGTSADQPQRLMPLNHHHQDHLLLVEDDGTVWGKTAVFASVLPRFSQVKPVTPLSSHAEDCFYY